MKVCPFCGDKFPDVYQVCGRCLIELPENKEEEKKKENKLAKIFGSVFTATFSVGAVVTVVALVMAAMYVFERIDGMETYLFDESNRISCTAEDGSRVYYDKMGNAYEDGFDVPLYGKDGEVYTYLAVREDGISLYGFSTIEEKNMFLKLITVSGVGPKSGIAILSAIDISSLATMIATEDVKGLSKIKGLGKKTAERIILELREKVEASYYEGETKTKKAEDSQEDQDAIIALMSLGFTKTECAKAVKEAKENGANTIEQIIAYSIKHIK